jgi:hypothetical protein
MNPTSAKLTLITADRMCRESRWQGTTNVVHAVLHDESIPVSDLIQLFPRRQSKWGLSIQSPYAPPRRDENEFETLTVLLQAEGANVHPYKLGAFTQSGRAATAPLKTIAEGVRAATFFLRLEESQMNPVCLTAYATLNGIILAETQLEVPTSEMGGSEVVSQHSSAFKRVFVSYAREDLWLVKLVDSAVSALGVVDFRWDLKVLKAGDNWAEVLYDEIRNADSFQLFWSRSARTSDEVKKEWMYAVELKRERFIRPVYWEEPLEPPPPSELNHLHFALIPIPGKMM